MSNAQSIMDPETLNTLKTAVEKLDSLKVTICEKFNINYSNVEFDLTSGVFTVTTTPGHLHKHGYSSADFDLMCDALGFSGCIFFEKNGHVTFSMAIIGLN